MVKAKYDRKYPLTKSGTFIEFGYYVIYDIAMGFHESVYDGVVDKYDNLIVPMNYRKIFMSDDAKMIIGEIYQAVDVYNNVGNFLGTFKEAKFVKNNDKPFVIVKFDDESYNVIDYEGNMLFEQNFDFVFDLENGMFACMENRKEAIFTSEGKPLSSTVYDTISPEKNGLIVCQLNDKYGALDSKGNIVIPFEYEELDDFNEKGIAIAKKNGLYGIINKENKTLIDFKYASLSYNIHNEFIYSYASLSYTGKQGIIGKDGKEWVPCVCDKIWGNESYEYIPFEIDGKKGYVDMNGKVYMGKDAIEFKYKLQKDELKYSNKKALKLRYLLLDIKKNKEMKKEGKDDFQA